MKFKSTHILLALILLIGAQVTYATWTPPLSVPPADNVPAPINVGSDPQQKTGLLGADILFASSSVRSDLYCDRTGTVCSSGVGGGGGNEMVVLGSSDRILAGNVGVASSYDLVGHGYPSNIIRVLLIGTPATYMRCIVDPNDDRGSCYNTTFTDFPIVEQNNLTTDGKSHKMSIGPEGVWVTLLKGPNINFASPQAAVKADLIAYECLGTCGAPTVPTCSVNFSWNIKGGTGSVTRNFPESTDPIAVGMYYHYDNDATLPWTETLHQTQWGSATFDNSEKGKVGYASSIDYINNRTALVGWDESFWAIVKPLNLVQGQSISLVNEEYIDSSGMGGNESIYSGDVQIIATVTSCR